MTTRYHITRSGGVARCEASVRACPNGGEHYATKAEAMLAAEPLELASPMIQNPSAKESDSPIERMAANESYARFLQQHEANNGVLVGNANYQDSTGRFVSRDVMIAEIKKLEARDDITNAFALRKALYSADAAALRQKKTLFRQVHDEYRAANGPARRPNFTGIIEEINTRKAAKLQLKQVQEREAKLAQISDARAKREQSEDVISLFGKSRREASRFDSQEVPAARIGEFVGEKAEDFADFFGEAKISVRELFARRA